MPMNSRLFHGRDRGVFRGGVKAGTSNDRQHTLQSVVNRWAGMLKGQVVLGPEFKDVERPKIVTGKAQSLLGPMQARPEACPNLNSHHLLLGQRPNYYIQSSQGSLMATR